MLLAKWLKALHSNLANGFGSTLIHGRGSRLHARRSRISNCVAFVEAMESRRMLTAIVVNSASDLPDAQLPAGSVTLRDAIATANADGSGDTITFASNLAGLTITLARGELDVTGSMTISGLGTNSQPTNLTIDGNFASTILSISGDSTQSVTIDDLTLKDGNSFGQTNSLAGDIYNQSNLTLENDAILAGSSDYGGGVYNSGVLTVENSQINNDGASGIWNANIANISHTSFSSDSTDVGAIGNIGTLTSAFNTFNENGGGINSEKGVATSTFDHFVNNAYGILNTNSQVYTLNDFFNGNTRAIQAAGPVNGADGTGVIHSANDTITNNGQGVSSQGKFIGVNDTIVGDNIGVETSESQDTTLINSIAAGNLRSSLSDVVGILTAASSDNLIGIPLGMTLSQIVQTVPSSNPPLVVYATNGGPLPTIALVTGSPAIGKSEALATVTSSGDGGTTLTVDNTQFIGIGDFLQIGTEIVQVTAVNSGQTISVSRAQGGTTQSNLDGAPVTLAYDARGFARISNDLGSFAIEPSMVTNVARPSGTYTGQPFSVTNADVIGVNGETIASLGNSQLSFDYYAGTLSAADLVNATALSKAPTNVGNYTVVAVFKSIAGYLDSVSVPVHFSITPATLMVAATTTSKSYDGTTATTTMPSVVGLKGTDSVSNLSESFESKDVLGVGNSTLMINPGYVVNDGNGGNNYVLTVNNIAPGTITPATLTISANYNVKVYNGTTAALEIPRLTGLEGSDSVTGLSESYLSPNVLGVSGSTLQVNTGYVVNDGNGGNDYSVVLKNGAGTINPHYLEFVAKTNTKVYDGTTAAAAIPTVFGLEATDTVTGLSEAYTSKNVMGANGSTLMVTAYQVNDGNSGNNYVLTVSNTAGTITPATLTISAAYNAKVYNGTTAADQIPRVAGLEGTDSVTGLSESYVSPNVLGVGGSTLQVNSGYVVNDGNGGNDYTVVLKNGAGTINPHALAIIATTNTKIYDGTTAAAAIPMVMGLIGTDTVTGLAEAYASKNVMGVNGSTLMVTAYQVNDGNAGNNYVLTVSNTAGTINPHALTIAAAMNTKVYDGTTTAAALPTVLGLMGTDKVTGLAESYQSKNVMGANGSVLVVSSDTIMDNNDGKNYVLTLPNAPGTITPASLTISAASNTKTYDSTTAAYATPTYTGLAASDLVTNLHEAYSSRNVMGANRSTLDVTGYTVFDGNGGNNYDVILKTATGTITPAFLIINATPNTKVYDGTTAARAVPTVLGLMGTDTVTGLAEAYLSKNVSRINGSLLRVTSYVIHDGNHGKNYAVVTTMATGTITRRH